MPSKATFAPTVEFRSIAAASLKAFLIGALLITLVFMAPVIFHDAESLRLWYVGIQVLAMAFAIAFAAGMIATSLCLLIAGAIVARLIRPILDRPFGLMIALRGATALSIAFGLVFATNEPWAGALIALVYAIPAAVFYRREIALECALN
ncbi:MAG: hypothetical protein AAFQ90_04615 [Pseudomonadota bacterium]